MVEHDGNAHVLSSGRAIDLAIPQHNKLAHLIRIDAEPKGNLQGTQHRLRNGNGWVIEGQCGVVTVLSVQLNTREGTIDENFPITIPGHNQISLYRRRCFGWNVESI